MDKKFELTPEIQAKIEEIKNDQDVKDLTQEELDAVSGGTAHSAGQNALIRFISCGHECMVFTNHYHEDGRRLYYCYECNNFFYSSKVIVSLAPEMLGYTPLSQAELDELFQKKGVIGSGNYDG